MLVIHRALVSANHTWMSTVAAAGTVVLALIQIAVTASLRRKKGKFTFRGRKIDTQFSKNAYLMLTITPIVMVALTAVVVLAAKPCHDRTGCGSGISVHHCGILHREADVIIAFFLSKRGAFDELNNRRRSRPLCHTRRRDI